MLLNCYKSLFPFFNPFLNFALEKREFLFIFFYACDVKVPWFRYKFHERWKKTNTIVSPTAPFIHVSPALRLALFGAALIFPLEALRL